jgi:hypothetical protein
MGGEAGWVCGREFEDFAWVAGYFLGFGGAGAVDSPIQPGGSLAGKDSSEASSTGSRAELSASRFTPATG